MASRGPNRAEIAAFLEGQPPSLTYSALAAALAARFGGAAWGEAKIRAFFLKSRAAGRGRVAQDAAVRAFVLDRIGRQNGDAILAGLRAAFPAERVPSRSALYRFMNQETARHALKRSRRSAVSAKSGK